MRQYISEERAIYEDMYHGQFSKRLADWAISKMRKRDLQTQELKAVPRKTAEEVAKVMKQYGAELPEKFKYTASYLWHMALADYQNALATDEHRAYFVYETLMDPDGCPADTLDCFVAKMQNAGEPIYWEEMV